MAGKLAPSISRIWTELDARWPHRDRRTDGWYASPKDRISKGHNPGHNGYSHAIDVDKDGIDPMWIINNIAKDDRVLWYIIWNRTLYSNTYDWKPKKYTGKNPHTDHMHIEIYQTDYAETWTGRWKIKPPTGIAINPDAPDNSTGAAGTYNGDFGTNYGGRDYRGLFVSLGDSLGTQASAIDGYRRGIAALRK